MDNKLYNTDHEAGLNFMNWYLYTDHAEEIDPTLGLLSHKAGFHLGEYVSSQNNRFPVLIHEVLLHDIMVGVWWAVRVTRITGFIPPPPRQIHTDVLHTF
jgi:hypothetical protein